MSLIFKKLRYKNFLSVGNDFIEFDFQKNKTTLIVGKNGSGKSSFIDALVFALYGKPYRKINKPQLINSINCKNLLVELEFSAGKRNIFIRRGLKPAIFEIHLDGDLIDQDSNSKDYQENFETNILKIGYKSFNQIIVLGSANHMPFMQLPSQNRREVVEDLLDIQVFSIMNSLLKERVQEHKDNLKNNEMNLTLTNSKLEMVRRHLLEMKENTKTFLDEKRNDWKEIQIETKLLEEKINKIIDEIIGIRIPTIDYQSKANELFNIRSKLSDKKERLSKDLNFYASHDNCPTCKQAIDQNFKKEIVTTKNEEVENLVVTIGKANEKYDKLLRSIGGIQEQQKRIDDLNKTINEARTGIKYNDKIKSKLEKEIEKIEKKNDDLNDNISDESQLIQEQNELLEEKKLLNSKNEVLMTAAALLKDGGIKTRIIKQYVPIMNKLILKYLAEMDFFIRFELDENFNEKILSRHRDEFSYESFSEGEKFRIDISLLFTWRAIAKLRNRATCNLLILDEIFDGSLDSAGTDEFLKIIDSLAGGTNVFMISHSSQIVADKFEKVIKFEKVKNFTQLTGAV